MKEYLKMADEFTNINDAGFGSDLEFEFHATSFSGASGDDYVSAKYATHAIKEHDGLVAEVDILKEKNERIVRFLEKIMTAADVAIGEAESLYSEATYEVNKCRN